MAKVLNFSLNESTFEKMRKKKDEMGFVNKSWNDWFKVLFDNNSIKKDTKQIIEDIFQKTSYEKWFDVWIKNFALNLENIWSGHSAKELIPIINEKSKKYPSGIVIGRGPSLKKNNHLDLLANSNFNGTIICSDGILKNALKAGVIPDIFEKFFVVTVDAQDIQLDLYDDPIIEKFGNKIKAIFSTATSPKVIKRAQEIGMEIFWLHTLTDYDKGKSSFNHMSSLMTKCKKHLNGLPAIQTGVFDGLGGIRPEEGQRVARRNRTHRTQRQKSATATGWASAGDHRRDGRREHRASGCARTHRQHLAQGRHQAVQQAIAKRSVSQPHLRGRDCDVGMEWTGKRVTNSQHQPQRPGPHTPGSVPVAEVGPVPRNER